jgi:DNA-binding winged helix-turn-helix (wHTH) protein
MQGSFHLGDWLIQPATSRITRDGQTVHVRAKVMDLLVFLAQRPGEVVSKDTLLEGVWGTDALSESALTRSMTELRQALDDDAERPTVIETIPKRGYRVIVPVQPVVSNRAIGHDTVSGDRWLAS